MPTWYDPFMADDGDEEHLEPVAKPDVEPESEPEPEPDPVPVGSTREIIEWVGGDEERARLALAKEEAHPQPRKGLLKQLREQLGE